MTAPRVVPRPLAVLRGRAAAEVLSSCTGSLLLLSALWTAPLLVHRLAPWPSLTSWLVGGGWVVYGLATLALVLAAQHWATAREGRAEVFADRVILRKDDRVDTLRFAELTAFDDARGDLVRLLRPHPWPAARVESVPTPDEAGRAVLIDALAAAGVRRHVGAEAAEVAKLTDASPRLPVAPDPRVVRRDVLGCLAFTVGPIGLVILGVVTAGHAGRVAAVAIALTCLAALLTFVRASPRPRSLTFFDDRIVLGAWDPEAQAPRPQLSWDDVIAWRSGGPDRLRLVLRVGLLAEAHREPVVPTPTPEVRAAVEALLAEKGVPRIA